ncbi:MAG: FtsX-like permease family protein [Candidatus Thorarchaeota archaeon]|nr:FtsX-like permease family protein [Candidatus Thorarchaeota archaeon]
MPLLVILTLILSSTNMLLVELDGYHHNLQIEVDYAIGADFRIEVDNGTIELAESFKHIRGIVETMPVIEFPAKVGENQFFLEGVKPEQYSRIGHFREDSFTTNTSDGILETLESIPNGIVLSEYHGALWNKSVGDTISITYFRPEIAYTNFVIVGFVESAPGFGMASTEDLGFGSVASGFGFQIGRGGFALANFDFLQNYSSTSPINRFFGSFIVGTNLEVLSSIFDANFGADIYAPGYTNPREISRSVDLYLSGFESVVSISVVLLGLMGVFAILTLLSAAVRERSKEYALLRAVGAKNNQVVSLVFQEFAAVVVAAMAVSLVIGAALGMTLGALAFGISPMWSTLLHPPYLPLHSLLILSALELVVLSIACLIPARHALSETPSEALRNL